jgi:hypothetical protein
MQCRSSCKRFNQNQFLCLGDETYALMDRHHTPTQIFYFIVVLCVLQMSLFYSVTTVGSMDIPYIRRFLQLSSLSHHQIFEFFTFICTHLLVFLHRPVFTYWNVGLVVACNAITYKKVYSFLRTNINYWNIKSLKLNVYKIFFYVFVWM